MCGESKEDFASSTFLSLSRPAQRRNTRIDYRDGIHRCVSMRSIAPLRKFVAAKITVTPRKVQLPAVFICDGHRAIGESSDYFIFQFPFFRLRISPRVGSLSLALRGDVFLSRFFLSRVFIADNPRILRSGSAARYSPIFLRRPIAHVPDIGTRCGRTRVDGIQ